MKSKKGAISIFALLSMMFFLIFIMVAYNNVAQKSKTQVETEEILVSYYKPTRSAQEIVNAINGGTTTKASLKGCFNNKTEVTNGSYVLSNGKYYLVNN